MYKRIMVLLCMIGYVPVFAQTPGNLPVTLFHHSDTTKPLMIYITGDGGMNSFSKSLVQNFHAKGYGVVTLNAKEYFWKKKAPQVAADDLSRLIRQYLAEWKRGNVVLTGYSFGADVSPFILSRLSNDVQSRVKQVVLLSPSERTGFEIKFSDMLGIGKQEGENVVAEVNKVNKPVLFVFGRDEKDFPINKVIVKNKRVLTLAGGHHYGGDIKSLGDKIVDWIELP